MAIEEAVTIRRRLAEARPGAFLPDLARSLNTLSNRLSNLGDREAALAAIDEGVEILRRLAEVRPDAFLPDLTGSLNNLSNELSSLGRREAALAVIEEAVAILRPLAAAGPDVMAEHLALSLWVRADRLDETERYAEAVDANAEAIETLLLPFMQHPSALAGRMHGMVGEYIERCKSAGVQFNIGLLEPIIVVLMELRGPDAASG